MVKVKELEQLIAIAQGQIKSIVIQIAEVIERLPDNPNINRLGSGCYSISSSAMGGNWSPTYHDYRLQYRLIAAAIVSASDPLKQMERILTEGVVNGAGRDAIKLHPDVIKQIEELKSDI